MRRKPPRRQFVASGHVGTRRWLLAIVLLAAAVGLIACGSSSSQNTPTTAKEPGPAGAAQFAGPANQTPFPAKPLRLRNSLGHVVDIRDYRGKAVLVTFVYTHCPDVCPLIVGNLHSAQAQLGTEARKLQLIAVSTDAKGDTTATVKRFLRQHEMTGKMEYLIGSQRQLERVWTAWGIVAKHDKKTPELVEHSAAIFGIGASGKVLTLYPSDVKPARVVHDVPVLAAR